MPHTGHCFCGEVTYSVAADPIGCRMCWCRDCQYIASGSATINVLFPPDAVHYSGAIATIIKTADSGNTVERGFCPTCGSQMYSRTVEPAGLPIRVRSGTLDNPDLMAPTAIIWAASAPAWAELDPKLPQPAQGPGSPLIETYS